MGNDKSCTWECPLSEKLRFVLPSRKIIRCSKLTPCNKPGGTKHSSNGIPKPNSGTRRMKPLTEPEKSKLTQLIASGKPLPESWRYRLFPDNIPAAETGKEYRLVCLRRKTPAGGGAGADARNGVATVSTLEADTL